MELFLKKISTKGRKVKKRYENLNGIAKEIRLKKIWKLIKERRGKIKNYTITAWYSTRP